jgi:hypothetical protein
VKEFFCLLDSIFEDNFDSTRIYDVDKTALTTVQKKPRGVVLKKGRSKCTSCVDIQMGKRK